MPSRSSSQKAARGNSQARTTMSPETDPRKSRPVWLASRSYRCGTMETSRPVSSSRAAAMLSSSARRVGFLPCACDSTTVNRDRLMARSVLFVDLALDQTLGLLPVVRQVLVIAGHVHEQRWVFRDDVEQPTGPVAIDVDRRRIIQQGGVEFCQGAGHGREQVGLGLGRFDVADLLQEGDGVAGVDGPVEEVDVLHEADGVGGEAEAPAAWLSLAGPHVIAGVA